MKSSRKKTRKLLFQQLFAHIYNEVEKVSFLGAFFDNIFDFTIDEDYLIEMKELILKNEGLLLGIIARYAPKFDIETMNKTTILATFIGVTEMYLLSEEIPGKVSINESIEIAKVYGDESSKKVVNGILNSFYNDIKKNGKIDVQPKNDIKIFTS